MIIDVDNSRDMALIVNSDNDFFKLHWKSRLSLKKRIGDDIFTSKKLLIEIEKLTKEVKE